MRNKRAAAWMSRLVRGARYEVLPTGTVEDKVLQHVPVEQSVTVTASPSKGLEATLDLAERLTGHGYSVVPHLAARMVRDKAELAEICERLSGKGITKIFVPGGDADPPGGYAGEIAWLCRVSRAYATSTVAARTVAACADTPEEPTVTAGGGR